MACYILNDVSTKSSCKTPYELWHGKKPTLNHFRIWGLLAHVLDKDAKKLDARTKLCMFELIGLSIEIKPIGCQLIYKKKRNSEGKVETHKARLVRKGYTQKECIDYDETFSPIAMLNSILILISIAVDYEILQMDVRKTFLNGFLDETIYMAQPISYVFKGKEQNVCDLYREMMGNRICDLSIIPNGPNDWIIWFHNIHGVFTTESTYSRLLLKQDKDARIVWEREKALNKDFYIHNMIFKPILPLALKGQKWKKLPNGFVKVKVDVACRNNTMSYGIIIHDCGSLVIGGQVGVKDVQMKPEWAELYALSEEVLLACDINLGNINFETNYANMVNRLQKCQDDI
ncbi:hypothetical protein PVK06_040043 [Gossypium arboreum]|uniref:Reverse transcriptase Ty1/copia-type domain-containing protein n=1 Tax=Gossypium arboreum TaxID=29729 RepID=A0ABR0N4F9_GOSAR|nr:hypothetical protein PVK06_040043 [Gossypium arboreum]